MDNSLNTLLEKDPVANMAAIGYFKNYPLESFHVSGESAILSGTSDFLWYHIIAKDDNELKHLLNSVAPVPSRFFSIEDWMIPVIETF